MTRPRRLFGIETEYALAAFGPHGERLDGDRVGGQIVRLARTRRAALPGRHATGVFLANGQRLYVDVGAHLEACTPECTTPGEGVRYVLAGDRLVRDLADEVVATEPGIHAIVLGRCNVEYGGGGAETWASHENQLYRGDPEILAREIVPHLVSRLVYTGAGGFDNRSSGVSFLLSPRVAHLVAERSTSSTSGRGIFHQKHESLAGGEHRRLHVLCGESSCSRRALWLRLGATALVVALVEAGLQPGRAVRLREPLEAMRAFARDPECRVEAPSCDGRMLSAIAIQRHYLEQAEASLGAPWMPEWADEVCRVWRATLAALEHGPEAVATTLDWAIKLTLFRRHAERRGFAWTSVGHWTFVADQLADALTASGCADEEITVEAALACRRHPVPTAVARLGEYLAAQRLGWDGLRPFVDLRKELCEIDVRYGELGERGVFTRLARGGLLDDQAPGVGDVAGAVDAPPARGRARLRGEAVRALARRRPAATVDWHGVWDRRGKRMLDLRDPFAEDVAWQPWAPSEADEELELPWLRRRRALSR